ncbi:unnamed protein product [Bursaphelenchus xylophilus]|nr:unnamed protein product [Bursaphelenchus xylophilus]CAG9084710.1 unnamed protein product [Bursaphelenchus xylophilus]
MQASVGLLYVQAICCLLQCLLVYLTDQTCTTLSSPSCVFGPINGGASEFRVEVHNCFQMDLHDGWDCVLNECGRPQRLNQWLLLNLMFNLVWFLLYIGLPSFNLYTSLIQLFCDVICRGWLILGVWGLYNDWYLPWNLEFHPVFPHSCIYMAWIHLMSCLTVALLFYSEQSNIYILSSANFGVYQIKDDDRSAAQFDHKKTNMHLPDVDVSHV